MKKTLLLLSLGLLFILSPEKTHAQFTVICPLCSQRSIQYVQTAKEGITATQQTLSTIKQTILDPIKNAMTLVSILTSSNQISNLILGSTNGNSLLIRNPEQYITNKGLNSVNANLGSLSTNGPYTDSIFNAAISAFKNTSTEDTLKQINTSSIPSLTQKENCTDAALTAQAKKDVMRSNNTFDQTELQARKQTIYNAICKCNPSTDAKCAQTLTAVNNQKPSLNSFYAVTQGDNQYTKTTRSLLEIGDAKQKVEGTAQKDLISGGGIASKTQCTKYGTDVNGKSLCTEEVIDYAASQLKTSYEQAVNAPLNAELATLGSGFGFGLSDIFSFFGGIKNLANTFTSLDPSGGVTTSGSSNTSVITKNTSVPDSPSVDPALTTEATTLIEGQIRSRLNDLSSLLEVDKNYLAEINIYKSRIDMGKSCYDSLISDYPYLQSSSEVTPATTFFSGKQTITNNLLATISKEINLIPVVREKINATLESIAYTNSSQDILNQFTAFQNYVDSNNLKMSLERQGEYDMFTYQAGQDTSNEEGNIGIINTYTSKCNALRIQQQNSNQNGYSNF